MTNTQRNLSDTIFALEELRTSTLASLPYLAGDYQNASRYTKHLTQGERDNFDAIQPLLQDMSPKARATIDVTILGIMGSILNRAGNRFKFTVSAATMDALLAAGLISQTGDTKRWPAFV